MLQQQTLQSKTCDWKFSLYTQVLMADLQWTNVECVENHVWSAICLHKWLRLRENATYTPAGFVDSSSSSGDIRNGDRQKICSVDNLGFQEIKKNYRFCSW